METTYTMIILTKPSTHSKCSEPIAHIVIKWKTSSLIKKKKKDCKMGREKRRIRRSLGKMPRDPLNC